MSLDTKKKPSKVTFETTAYIPKRVLNVGDPDAFDYYVDPENLEKDHHMKLPIRFTIDIGTGFESKEEVLNYFCFSERFFTFRNHKIISVEKKF